MANNFFAVLNNIQDAMRSISDRVACVEHSKAPQLLVRASSSHTNENNRLTLQHAAPVLRIYNIPENSFDSEEDASDDDNHQQQQNQQQK
ncbi:unnamed protein product [Rotaria sp. Silwood2]|nr:unnamed protein product [Rotaria sp. Silwood2]